MNNKLTTPVVKCKRVMRKTKKQKKTVELRPPLLLEERIQNSAKSGGSFHAGMSGGTFYT